MAELQDRGFLELTTVVRDSLLRMSGHVEAMTRDAMHALTHCDKDLAERTAALDVHIDRLEVDVDNRCVVGLARFRPVGEDLRFLVMSLKMVTDLERLGDLAVNICERVLEMPEPTSPFSWDLATAMGRLTESMVHRAVTAFVTSDEALAHAVIAEDDDVDALYNAFFQQVFEAMGQQPASLRGCVHALSIGKWLERMADHATNLADHALFLVHGEQAKVQQCKLASAS